jgi:hypothetical protein
MLSDAAITHDMRQEYVMGWYKYREWENRIGEIKQLVSYDPDTGLFHWKIQTYGRGGIIVPGDVAGTRKDGYIQINLSRRGGRIWRAHILAYLLMTGTLPPDGYEIDHIDRSRSNNRWSNLRLLTRSRNTYNADPRIDNISGVKGVSWITKEQKWDARITLDGKTKLLGRFVNKDDAIAARKQAELAHDGDILCSA